MLDPFLKWPGGKRWLLNRVPAFPTSFSRYLEPFLGGGAVFFHIGPSCALLSDTNAELIHTYQCAREFPEEVHRKLLALERQHSKAMYYRVRSSEPRSALGRAVRFLYLNRTCFNGLYRVNRRGEFNVPIGTKDTVAFPTGYLSSVAKCLSAATLRVADFQETMDEARAGDFVFVDPPYSVVHNNNNFIKYNSRLFSWADQVRLAAAIRRAAERGAAVMLSNAYHRSVRALYLGFGYHYRIARTSVLAADSRSRRETAELLVTTFPLGQNPGSRVCGQGIGGSMG